MRSMRQFLKILFLKILHLVPWWLLEKLERKIQIELGKGWGSATTEAEAKNVAEIARQIISGDLIVYDIGANVGDWSDSIQKYLPDSRVFAFEPSKEAFDRLTKRFATSTRVTSVNLALGKENTETFLYADSSASGLGSLTKRRVKHFGLSFEHREPVKVLTLDKWVESQPSNFAPNIVKLDVEGHELDVLMGASKSLNQIQIVQFEFGGGNIDTKTYFQDFWYFFESNRFEIKRLTPRGLKTISQYSEAFETFMPTNYLAVRRQS
jgi:FkbM family methyltransferase